MSLKELIIKERIKKLEIKKNNETVIEYYHRINSLTFALRELVNLNAIKSKQPIIWYNILGKEYHAVYSKDHNAYIPTSMLKND